MDHVFAVVKDKRKQLYFKLVSDAKLFQNIEVNVDPFVSYNPDHNLDEDAWFKVERFSAQSFCPVILTEEFDEKEYDELTATQFGKINCLVSVQDGCFYFQKITPSLFVRKKTLLFGESFKIENDEKRIVVNDVPDAIYFPDSDTLIFRSLATISSVFSGIDLLYKEATNEEVESFLVEPFIGLVNDYDASKVSKPNRKRISLAMDTLATMSVSDKVSMLDYIDDYCSQKLVFNKAEGKFEISTDDELKLLLYGIEQRFYTTPFGHEKRLANSVMTLG